MNIVLKSAAGITFTAFALLSSFAQANTLTVNCPSTQEIAQYAQSWVIGPVPLPTLHYNNLSWVGALGNNPNETKFAKSTFENPALVIFAQPTMEPPYRYGKSVLSLANPTLNCFYSATDPSGVKLQLGVYASLPSNSKDIHFSSNLWSPVQTNFLACNQNNPNACVIKITN